MTKKARNNQDYRIWNYKGMNVYYKSELDGGGTWMAKYFINHLLKNYAASIPFSHAFEWCAGPGFIGLALSKRRNLQKIDAGGY